MTLILSIIASPPEGVEPKPSDGNSAIDDIVKMMTKRAENDPKLAVRRAAYVGDIADILKEFNEPPSLIQIIGHGSPGRLQLGQYWTGHGPHQTLGHSVLDSSPASYGMLNKRIAPATKVLLLGCSVGSQQPSGFIGSGRALLFDLEDMTGADVYAADDTVSPKDFDDDFFYKGSLVTSTGKTANPMANIRAVFAGVSSVPPVQGAQALEAQSLVRAPALGIDSTVQLQLSPSAQSFFSSYRRCDPQPAGLLAMTELELKLEGGASVEIVSGLRYARVRDERGTDYFERDRSVGSGDREKDAEEVLAELRDAYVKSIFTPHASALNP